MRVDGSTTWSDLAHVAFLGRLHGEYRARCTVKGVTFARRRPVHWTYRSRAERSVQAEVTDSIVRVGLTGLFQAAIRITLDATGGVRFAFGDLSTHGDR